MYCSSGPEVGLTSAKESITASLTVSLNIFIFQLHLQSFSLLFACRCVKMSQIWIPALKAAWDHPAEYKNDLTARKSSLRGSVSQIDHAVLFGVQNTGRGKANLSMPPCGSVWILIKHWRITFPEPAVRPDSRLPSVSFKCWLFVLDVRVKCCGKKTGSRRKPSGVSLVTIWAPEGSRSSAKTVDPQFHFKGMEVWKQAGETHRKGRSRKWDRI